MNPICPVTITSQSPQTPGWMSSISLYECSTNTDEYHLHLQCNDMCHIDLFWMNLDSTFLGDSLTPSQPSCLSCHMESCRTIPNSPLAGLGGRVSHFVAPNRRSERNRCGVFSVPNRKDEMPAGCILILNWRSFCELVGLTELEHLFLTLALRIHCNSLLIYTFLHPSLSLLSWLDKHKSRFCVHLKQFWG